MLTWDEVPDTADINLLPLADGETVRALWGWNWNFWLSNPQSSNPQDIVQPSPIDPEEARRLIIGFFASRTLPRMKA